MNLAEIQALQNRAGTATAGASEVSRQATEIGRPAPFGVNMPTSMAIEQTMAAAKGMNGGFKGFGQFAHAVRSYGKGGSYGENAPKFKRMIETWGNDFEMRQKDFTPYVTTKANSPLGMNEMFTLEDGGILVPPEYVAQILMRTYTNDLLARCTVFPIGGSQINIPAINESSRADGSRFGGVTAYWRREAGTVTFTKPSLMDIKLELNSLMLLMRATDELLQDTGGALELYLTTVAAQELTFKVGDSIVNGDGNGKPLGITKSASKITCPAESQAAGSLISENIVRMMSRLHVSARPNSIWIYDQSIETMLYKMTVGTAGANLAVFMPPGGLSGSPYATLLGRPMLPVEFCKQLGTEGDIILFDPTTYLAATKGGVQTAISMHLFFDTNEMAFRFQLRIDGKSWWLNPLTPKSAGPTQSNIITLATRA